MNTNYVFLANGFEEIEALATVDVLRRSGLDVKTVSITDDRTVTGSRGVVVVADTVIKDADFDRADWLIAPGGMPGAENLANSEEVTAALKAHAAKGKRIAAICASPAVVLAPLGLLDGLEATCYPGMQGGMPKAIYRDAPVIVTDRIITGNGPASTIRFALAIVASTLGEAVAQEVGSGLLYYARSMNFYF